MMFHRWFPRLALLFISAVLSRAGVITLSYTQYFDYNIAGVAGQPSATWTATFDTALEPTNPFQNAPSSVDADFTNDRFSVSEAPAFIWGAGGIEGATPASFTLAGTSYADFPFFPLFPTPPCALPCSAVATHADQALDFTTFTSYFSTTPDSYTAFAAVPEPASIVLFAAGLAAIALSVRKVSMA